MGLRFQSMFVRVVLAAGLLIDMAGCRSASVVAPHEHDVTATAASSARLRKDVTFLASDQMEGRGIGTKGLDRAAEFIAGEFKRVGLKPVGSDYYHRFVLAQEVEGEQKTIELKNVVGVWHGKGPRAREIIVVGAHYDHVGYGGRASLSRVRGIHNGADDNASGTAAMIELARLVVNEGPLDRTIVFVAFTAEEIGLVGSGRFVDNPPVDLSNVVAMINMDMVGRLRNQTLVVGGRRTALALDGIVNDADAASPLRVKEFSRDSIGPSDHLSFAKKRIPVLFLFTGIHSDYHRISDDADKINYDGIVEVVDFARMVLKAMTKMDRSIFIEPAEMKPNPPATTRGAN